MEAETQNSGYRSIFSPSTSEERRKNFESYWEFNQRHSGEIHEAKKSLSKKEERLKYFQDHPVRSKKPLANPDVFYRNYVHLKDDPTEIDEQTLFLMCIYKFARHEWVGIKAAWDVVPPLEQAKSLTDKISKYHLAEEFCHVKFFHEMFRTFHLDKVEWVSLGPVMEKIYKIFPRVPETLMSPPAFVTELMGLTFYQNLNRSFEKIFPDEPEACQRLRELLFEIMDDELAHIGQRRNFVGPLGIKMSKWMVGPLYRAFFRDIPETKHLFDVKSMIQEGLNFRYQDLPEGMIERSWVPTYCQDPTPVLSQS